jgi:RNA polymerase sigma factor (sigma-70 family)
VQSIKHRIIDQYRRHGRRPAHEEISPNAVADDTSPFERVVGVEALERYEHALESLRPEERQAIILRVELDLGYDEIAAELGKPSAAAARMAVKRAIDRLATAMQRVR